MAFRPCIDLKDGRVVQIVGGTLSDDMTSVRVNHISERSAAEFAAMYRADGLRGGHVIMLGPGNLEEALSALHTYPGGLQVGGGITPENANKYLDAGASHVIVTSFLFDHSRLSPQRLEMMVQAVGKQRLVIDLSCRRMPDGHYYIATNRWQTVTETRLEQPLITWLEQSCAEFLVHAADVEGRCEGIDQKLVGLLGAWVSIPTTYAGGARDLSEISLVERLSGGKVDLTIGSALDIFGGTLVRYADAAALGRKA